MVLLFAKIANHYDFMNHVLSFNLDVGWRRKLVDALGINSQVRVLDLCTGTADLAIEFAKRAHVKEVIGVDFSNRMLLVAKTKIKKDKLSNKIRLLNANVLGLSFADQSFDVVSMAFGLRNIPDRKKIIFEMYRQLKTGGYAAVLEFSPLRKNPVKVIFNFYLENIVYFLGKILASAAREYGYLSSSIQTFLCPQEINGIFEECGFKNIKVIGLLFGSVNIYIARRMD